jgi:ribosomal protein L32E
MGFLMSETVMRKMDVGQREHSDPEHHDRLPRSWRERGGDGDMRGCVSPATETDVECFCGKLVARWQGDELVIKCKRCGRFLAIHYSAIRGMPPSGLNPINVGNLSALRSVPVPVQLCSLMTHKPENRMAMYG